MHSRPAEASKQGGLARLKRRAEFLRVAGGRRRSAVPGLVLQVRRRTGADAAEGDPVRVGFTVSRKVGGAVERNRARRRLRAAAAAVMPGRVEGGHDYVIIGRRQTLDRPFGDLLRDLETALRRLHVLREGREPAPSEQPGRTGPEHASDESAPSGVTDGAPRRAS